MGRSWTVFDFQIPMDYFPTFKQNLKLGKFIRTAGKGIRKLVKSESFIEKHEEYRRLKLAIF